MYGRLDCESRRGSSNEVVLESGMSTDHLDSGVVDQ